MKKVLVVMGGLSSEREISILSGQNVAKALQGEGYLVKIYELNADISSLIKVLQKEKPDVVFNALHGKYGEDGCIQGLLNLMKIPYTHSGVLASSVGMDKAMTCLLAQKAGIPIPTGKLMTKPEFLKHAPKYPYVVKPNDDGSSVGVFIVKTDTDKKEALNKWPNNKKMLVEKYIDGRELSVAVLDGKGLGVVEIVPKTGYYDYKNKYTSGAAHHIIPADLTKGTYQKLIDMAEKVHKILGCRGISRSDFRLDNVHNPRHPKIAFLEINTNPGMTTLSLVPEIAKICQNLSYGKLVAHLVEEATCDV